MKFWNGSIRTVVCVSTIACVSIGLWSNVYALDLKVAYEHALAFDSTYLAEKERQFAVLQDVPSARSQLLPSLDLTLSTNETDEELSSITASSLSIDQEKRGSRNYNLKLNQVVYNANLFAQFKKAKLSAQLAEVELKDLQQDLIVRVARAYFDVLQAIDDQSLAKVNLDSSKLQYEQNKERYSVGLITLADYQQTLARWNLARANRLRSDNQRSEAERALEVITGLDGGNDYAGLRADIDKGDLYDVPSSDWKNQVLNNNFDIIRAQLNLKIAKKDVSIERSAYYPRVDLVVQRNTDSIDMNSVGLSTREHTETAMLQLSVPLFRGGGVRSEVRAAKYRRNSLEQDLRSSRLATIREARRLSDLSLTQDSIVEALDNASIASRLAKEAKEKGFSAGLGDNLEVLDAQRDFFQATLDANSAKYEALILGLSLKRLSGGLQVSDIDSINGLLLAESLPNGRRIEPDQTGLDTNELN